MKIKFLSFIIVAIAGVSLASCMDDHDVPNTDKVSVTSTSDIGEVNATILDVKKEFCSVPRAAEYYDRDYRFFSSVNKDMIIEGVVCANDISGNLYQTLLIRNIDNTKETSDPAHDQSIIFSVKSTALYPFFKLGQRIKINLNGLYAGQYSSTPRIGMPYISSSGNLNLGPTLFQKLSTNVQLVGKPDPNAPELVPIDLTDENGYNWLRSNDIKKDISNYPALVKVSGVIKEALPMYRDSLEKGTEKDVLGEKETLSPNGNKIFGPYELHDGGYGVSRTLILKENVNNATTVLIRTSTKNRVSFIELPENKRDYVGLMQYDSYNKKWQIQMRDTTDISDK